MFLWFELDQIGSGWVRQDKLGCISRLLLHEGEMSHHVLRVQSFYCQEDGLYFDDFQWKSCLHRGLHVHERWFCRKDESRWTPPPPVTRIRLDTIYPVYFNIFSADILVKFYFNSPKILHLNCGHLYCHQKSKHQKRNLSSQTLDYKWHFWG